VPFSTATDSATEQSKEKSSDGFLEHRSGMASEPLLESESILIAGTFPTPLARLGQEPNGLDSPTLIFFVVTHLGDLTSPEDIFNQNDITRRPSSAALSRNRCALLQPHPPVVSTRNSMYDHFAGSGTIFKTYSTLITDAEDVSDKNNQVCAQLVILGHLKLTTAGFLYFDHARGVLACLVQHQHQAILLLCLMLIFHILTTLGFRVGSSNISTKRFCCYA
jgi:hypothetical protein